MHIKKPPIRRFFILAKESLMSSVGRKAAQSPAGLRTVVLLSNGKLMNVNSYIKGAAQIFFL
jgi:hypothetical protein